MSEELRKVKDIVQSFQKSKKILRMYPANNPIYLTTLENDHKRFKEFFYYRDELTLKIRQNEMFFDAEQVYFNPDKDDNLSLFFFKDGLRELTFRKGLSYEELEDFFKIISLDFNSEVLDDDIVTLFWEKDFQNIHYVVDETVLSDDEEYEARAMQELEKKETEEDNLLKAYEDAFREEEVTKEASIVPLSDKDLQLLLKDLEKDSQDKASKLVDLLLEVFRTQSPNDYDDLVSFFGNAFEYIIQRGNIQTAAQTLSALKQFAEQKQTDEEARRHVRKIVLMAGSEAVIMLLGEVLDSGLEIEEKLFEDFVKHLDKNAIVPFMKILGELKSIHARKLVIDALILLGTKDIVTLARGLNDSRWYVVRNIIYILRKIGDKRAVDYLLKTVRHGDIRVKKEVIRALGELGGGGVLQALRECLDDADGQVRSAALKALGNISSEAAKRITMNKVSEKEFRDKEFEEKKEYFEVLSRWKDNDLYEFLMGTLKKKSFFRRARNYESRACAAYCLGLMGNKDALSLLNKYKNDGNKLLREYAATAIRRLEHGQ
ncbi:MAG: HEAT repeat domain-containing protein [Nitrospiraceae bacterium]|nr:HEAT repeat domain-containing protein [Nitrospiraceae bacterium]